MKKKRILAVILSICLAVPLSGIAFADGVEDITNGYVHSYTSNDDADVGVTTGDWIVEKAGWYSFTVSPVIPAQEYAGLYEENYEDGMMHIRECGEWDYVNNIYYAELTPETYYSWSHDGSETAREYTITISPVDGRPDVLGNSGDFIIQKGRLVQYIGDGGDVVVPYSVTSIGSHAFHKCESLTSVTIPESVTSIGDYAFYYCTNLTSVTIPESVTSIGDEAFGWCTSLTSIIIPDGVTSIGDGAFFWCTSLTSVIIPEGVTSIGHSAFHNCTSLTSVIIPEGVTSIGKLAFAGCTSLTSVTVPASVTSINSGAFYGCENLTDVYYGSGAEQWAKITCTATFVNDEDEFFEESISFAEGGDEWADLSNATIHYTESEELTPSEPAEPSQPTEPTEPTDPTPEEPETPSLEIIPEDSDTTYDPASGEDVVIHCTGALADFVRLLVDGEVVDPAYYTLTEGSTIVTISPDYLDTLTPGEHSVELVFTSGSVETTVTVLSAAEPPAQPSEPAEPTPAPDDTPNTGVESRLGLWVTLLALSGAGFVAVAARKRENGR